MRFTKTRLAAVIAGAAALAVSAAGCSSGGSGSDGASDQLEVFSFWTSGSESAALQALIDEYNTQYPGITVTNGAVAGGGGSNGTQVLQSRIAGNDAPDTWQTFPGDSLANYVSGGLVSDLSQEWSDAGLTSDNVPQSLIDLVSTDGKPYGIITGNHRNNVVWWNKAVAADLGLDFGDSVSWDEFTAGMQAAKAAGKDGACLGDKDIFASVIVVEMSILSELGADGMTSLENGDIDWSDPGVAAGLDKFSTIVANANSNHSALTWDQAVSAFANGDCLFNMFPDSAYGELLKLGLVDGTDFGYFPFPGTDGIFLNVADAFAVNSKLTGDAATNADNWIKVIASKEGQLAFNKLKGSTPMRTDVDTSSLGAYQQAAAASFKADDIIGTATFGITIPSSEQQALYDATTAYINSKDAAAFSSSMNAAAPQ
jgi:glucose/mannose transport system substrate-binding protein